MANRRKLPGAPITSESEGAAGQRTGAGPALVSLDVLVAPR
jgi:hypothetical protein